MRQYHESSKRVPPGVPGICRGCGQPVQILWTGGDDLQWTVIEPREVVGYVTGPKEMGGGMPRAVWPLHTGCGDTSSVAGFLLAVMRRRETTTCSELAQEFGISRSTVKAALGRLVRDGDLRVTRQGRRTFYSAKREEAA